MTTLTQKLTVETGMDWMHIRDIVISCIIGTRPVERRRKQKVILQVALAVDLTRAGRTDRLDDTVNYQKLREEICATVAASKFLLIERMADCVATLCLRNRRVTMVRVMVDKLGASAAVEILRRRKKTA